MNLALISLSINYDHQEHIYSLYEQLNYNKYQVITIGSSKKIYACSLDKNNYLVDCPDKPGIEFNTFFLLRIENIINILNKNSIDTILFDTSHVWNLYIIKRLRKKMHILHIIHDIIPHEGDKNEKGVFLYNKVIAKMVDKIIIHNRKFINKFYELYKFNLKNIIYLDLWRYYPQFNNCKETKQCLFFGRINKYKGIPALYQIVKKCSNINFNIVGRVDNDMEKYINPFNSLKNVTLDCSYVNDDKMKEYFDNADVVILPYESATQSGVIVDAYKFSRPCIAFDVGAISEQIENGVSGYLVEHGNIDAFSEKIIEIIFSNNKSDLCRKAWEFGFEKYSVQRNSERIHDMIQDS